MAELSRLLSTLLLRGVRQCGSYEPEEVLSYIEESLNNLELMECEAFLTWVSQNKKTFGHGNIEALWAEHQSTLR